MSSPNTETGFVAENIRIQKNEFSAHYDRFEIKPGKISVIIGPSGGGKTTLLRQCALVDSPAHGSISINGTTYWEQGKALQSRKLLWSKLAVVFQEFYLWPHLTAIENAVLPLSVNQQNCDEVDDLFEQLNISNIKNKSVIELSVGQRQRVAIARALAQKPAYLLFDEITSSLDNEQVHFLVKIIESKLSEGIGIGLITHHLAMARHFLKSDIENNFVFIDHGRITSRGTFKEYNSPNSTRLKSFFSDQYK